MEATEAAAEPEAQQSEADQQKERPTKGDKNLNCQLKNNRTKQPTLMMEQVDDREIE